MTFEGDHAADRMAERGISLADITQAFDTGRVIEVHVAKQRRLLLTFIDWMGFRVALHLVVADEPDGRNIVVTAYWPSIARWENDFATRRY